MCTYRYMFTYIYQVISVTVQLYVAQITSMPDSVSIYIRSLWTDPKEYLELSAV